MKRVIVLCTAWRPDYWESPEEAPYPTRSYKELPDWNGLEKNCPLPGLGIYIKQKEKDYTERPFVFLRIKGMRFDENTEKPYFDFEPIRPSSTPSKRLIEKIGSGMPELFSSLSLDKAISILQKIGEELPQQWKELIGEKEIRTSWRDYIGKYFLQIQEKKLSNDEFEDRIVALLNSLGFDVTQKGHTLSGEYADGIASFEDYAIVYDCKNTTDFFPSDADLRAIKKYLSDETKLNREKNLYPVFIAKSFSPQIRGEVFYFTVGSFIYLFYKKVKLGSKFTLAPIKKILENKTPLTNEIIDKEWRI